ncbi:MAG: ABC transporter substrate-binding protein, partial [Traorella sp.]
CGSKKVSTDGATIEIWHTFTEGQEALLETLAQEYMDANKGVTIKVVNTGAAKEFQGKVTDSVANGVGPNLIFEYASYAKSFDIEGQSYLLDFEKYWGSDYDYRSTLASDSLYVEGTNFSDGKLHVVPVYTAGALLFSNQDIYDQYEVSIPTTWDEMKTAAKTIYEKSNGKVVGLSFDSLTDFAQLLIYQCNEGKIVDLENNQPVFDNEKVLEWVKWWAEGVKEGYFQVAAQSADGYNSGDLNNGILASYVGSSAGMPYVDANQLGSVTNLTVTRVPMMSDEDEYHRAGIIWTRGAIGFNSNDEAENQLTADFVKFFVENNYRWVEELNANTPYTTVSETQEYKDLVAGDKALKALNEQVPYSFVAPNFTGVTEMRTELESLMKGAAGADFDAASALTNAANKVSQAMKQK